MNEQLILTGENALSQFERFLSDRKYSSYFIITDANVSEHCLPLLLKSIPQLSDAFTIAIVPGESSKHLGVSEIIIRQLLNHSADRNALIINLGGGVVTDIGGFTASVYKRGIHFVNLPTSLMGMVDASIGGKTAVNSSGVKNAIGTFHTPEAIFIYPPFLKTLPERALKSAYPEIIKHILLSDENKWKELITNPGEFFSQKNITTLIDHSSKFKKSVVELDFQDTGFRKSLNFGHTIGHAIESVSLKGHYPLLHGEAIAYGMVAESYLGVRVSGLDESVLTQLKEVVLKLFSTNKILCSAEDLLPLLKSDKKNNNNEIAFSLISAPGKYAGIFYPPMNLIIESINFMLNAFVDNSELVDDDN